MAASHGVAGSHRDGGHHRHDPRGDGGGRLRLDDAEDLDLPWPLESLGDGGASPDEDALGLMLGRRTAMTGGGREAEQQ